MNAWIVTPGISFAWSWPLKSVDLNEQLMFVHDNANHIAPLNKQLFLKMVIKSLFLETTKEILRLWSNLCPHNQHLQVFYSFKIFLTRFRKKYIFMTYLISKLLLRLLEIIHIRHDSTWQKVMIRNDNVIRMFTTLFESYELRFRSEHKISECI